MEIVALSSSSSDQKLRKSFKSDHLRRPIPLLKDFLLDDFSSCSSNGFKSFPRKAHCCAASVPLFLLDGDLKGRAASSASKRSRMSRSPSKAASATFSALHRASLKVLHKLLPYRPAVTSSSSGAAQSGGGVRRGILPRSLSRRLSKTRFWKKTAPAAAAAVVVVETDDSVTGRWKLFREFLEEKDPPPPSDKVCHRSAASVTSSSSGRNSSWDSSDFGSSVASSSSFSGNSVSSAVVSEVKKDSPLPPPLELEEEEEEVSDRVGVTVGGEESGAATTTECSKEGWQSEEKEQFSPVSVLDCPFHDDEEEETEVEVASSSSYSPVRVGETKRKHMHKAHRFKSLSQLEPVNLDQRLAVSELKNHPTEPTGFGAEAEELIQTMKVKYPSLGLGVDNLLSDFFMEKLEDGVSHDALNLADDWVNGREEVWLGWEVVKGRNAYLRAMEKGEVWMKLEGEKQKVALEVEVEIWTSLVEEMLLAL